MIFGATRARPPRPPRQSRRRGPDAVPEDLPPKLVPSLRQLASTAGSLVHTRLSLAGLELEEEMQRLITAAALGFVALMLISLALVVATFTIVAAVPPEYRVGTMIAITVVYLVIALILALRLKALFTNRPPIFSATLAELEKDKETLSQMARAHEAGEEARRAERARAGDDAYSSGRAASAAEAGMQGAR